MRLFWSVVLTGGLLLVGFDAYEASQAAPSDSENVLVEDGTPYPPPPPPPPR
jgi:hypothetical protein